jgi:hypothetical protein
MYGRKLTIHQKDLGGDAGSEIWATSGEISENILLGRGGLLYKFCCRGKGNVNRRRAEFLWKSGKPANCDCANSPSKRMIRWDLFNLNSATVTLAFWAATGYLVLDKFMGRSVFSPGPDPTGFVQGVLSHVSRYSCRASTGSALPELRQAGKGARVGGKERVRLSSAPRWKRYGVSTGFESVCVAVSLVPERVRVLDESDRGHFLFAAGRRVGEGSLGLSETDNLVNLLDKFEK